MVPQNIAQLDESAMYMRQVSAIETMNSLAKPGRATAQPVKREEDQQVADEELAGVHAFLDLLREQPFRPQQQARR